MDLKHMNRDLDEINTIWADCFDLIGSFIRLGRNIGQDVSDTPPRSTPCAQTLPEPSIRKRRSP